MIIYNPSPYRNLTWRKTDMNFEEKKNMKKWLKIPTRRQKIWSRNWKINYDVVKKSQNESKKFDTIDVGLCC